VNEKSARYAELDANMYIPEMERVQGQDTKNRQGSDGELPNDIKNAFLKDLQQVEATGKMLYKVFIRQGVAKELARVHLPVGVYTDWVWKMDLHNLFHFLGLRLDHHAQYEVRVYAEAIAKVIKDAYPMCWEAFEEYQLYAKTISRSDMDAIRAMLTVYKLDYPEKVKDANLKRVLDNIFTV
jgi:thymidylate synthase (FAD)